MGGKVVAGPRRRAGRRTIAVACALSMVLVSCGARHDPYLGAQVDANGSAPSGSNDQASAGPGVTDPSGAPVNPAGQGPSGQVPTGGTTPGGGTVPSSGGPSTTAPTGGGQQPPTAPAALTPDNFPFDPRAQAALCQGAAGNTASDTGIAPDSITVGNVSGISGVLANNFDQGSQAVQALFAAVNAAGGICGRKLRLIVQDDGQDATRNAANVADLIPKVTAFVGSVSSADNGGVPAMAQAKVPDLGPAINGIRGQSPVYWSSTGSSLYTENGVPKIYDSLPRGLKDAGNFPSKLATLGYSIPVSADAAKQFRNLFVRSGSSSCFEDYSVSPATASLDQDALQMKTKGCDGVFVTMDVTGIGKLLQAMQRQGYHPKYIAATYVAYTPVQITVAGQAAAQGFEVELPFVPFNDNHPVMAQYLNQLKVYQPGKQPSSFGFSSWASGEMFIYALIKAGRNPTRATITQALSDIPKWSTGGATSPIVPRDRKPAGPCSIEVEIKGTEFVRKWPASGFHCDGQLIAVN